MVQIKQSLLSINSNNSNPSSNQDTSLDDEINQITTSSLVKLAMEKAKIQRFLTSFIHKKTLQHIHSNWSPRSINRINSCCNEQAAKDAESHKYQKYNTTIVASNSHFGTCVLETQWKNGTKKS